MLRWPLVLVVALALAGCGADGDGAATDEPLEPEVEDPIDADEPEEAPADDPAEDPGTDDEAVDADLMEGEILTTAVTDLGDILVDGDGMTVYLFDRDADGTSACYDDCAATWPPLLAPVVAGSGIDDALLGEAERDDGETQITYGGHPLYYFAGDGAPGDLEGQGVGDVWWVVSAGGERITDDDGANEAPARDY